MTQNAIYWKTKTLVQLRLGTDGVARIAFNFNGNPTSSNAATSSILAIGPTGLFGGQVIRDFPGLANQYSQFRCAGAKFKYYPTFPPGSIQGVYTPMSIQYDRDGIEEVWNASTNTVPRSLEQVNQVKVVNQYRPFSFYRKAVKTRINTTIPTTYPPTDVGPVPNVNLSGRWLSTANTTSPIANDETMGTHIQILADAIAGDQEPGDLVGTLLLTTYYVFKDRL